MKTKDKLKSIAWKMELGWVTELTCFVAGGYLVGQSRLISGFIILCLGLVLALYVGDLIRKYGQIEGLTKRKI